MPVNPKRYIDKLLQGLEGYGKYYNISSKRFFSKNTGRYCMKYILENVQTKEKLEVYNKIEILKYLVREYSRETGQPVPEACLAPLEDEDNKLSSAEVRDSLEEELEAKRKTTAKEGGSSLKTSGVSVLENFKLRGRGKIREKSSQVPKWI